MSYAHSRVLTLHKTRNISQFKHAHTRAKRTRARGKIGFFPCLMRERGRAAGVEHRNPSALIKEVRYSHEQRTALNVKQNIQQIMQTN